MVQEFDGNIHQFTTVDIQVETGAAYEKSQFNYFKCRQVLNAIDDTSENINFNASRLRSAKPGDPIPFIAMDPFRMFSAEIGAAGIWAEMRSLTNRFASEAFLTRFAERKLTGLRRRTEFEEI